MDHSKIYGDLHEEFARANPEVDWVDGELFPPEAEAEFHRRSVILIAEHRAEMADVAAEIAAERERMPTISECELATRVVEELELSDTLPVADALSTGEYSLAIVRACSIAQEQYVEVGRDLLVHLADFATQCARDNPDSRDAREIRWYLARALSRIRRPTLWQR